MDEKTTDEAKEEKPTADNVGEGSKPEVYKPIDDANLAAKRLEEANKKKEELLNREEDIIAKKALGGTTEAGSGEKKEETPQEYAKRVMRNEL